MTLPARKLRGLRSSRAGSDPRYPLGSDHPALRPDGPLRNRHKAGHRTNRRHPAPIYSLQRADPVYRALSELGKAVKTIFLCRYLGSLQLRREIHEGLNVIESWNGVNDFIFFGKGGEMASNRADDEEISMLSLHLLQLALVYANTLMIQQILAESAWATRLNTHDLRGITPLLYGHVNP